MFEDLRRKFRFVLLPQENIKKVLLGYHRKGDDKCWKEEAKRRFKLSGYQNKNCLGCGLLVKQYFSAELAHFIVIQCSSVVAHL